MKKQKLTIVESIKQEQQTPQLQINDLIMLTIMARQGMKVMNLNSQELLQGATAISNVETLIQANMAKAQQQPVSPPPSETPA